MAARGRYVKWIDGEYGRNFGDLMIFLEKLGENFALAMGTHFNAGGSRP